MRKSKPLHNTNSIKWEENTSPPFLSPPPHFCVLPVVISVTLKSEYLSLCIDSPRADGVWPPLKNGRGLRILSLTPINHLPLSPACEYLHYTFGYSSGYFLALNNTLKALSSKTFLIMEISNRCKSNIQKTKIMASGPITSWQIDGETMKTGTDFILGGLQNHCRWWLQPWN